MAEDDYDYTYGSMLDLGDVDIIHTDTEQTHENVRETIRMLLAASPDTLPLTLGGDHSVTAPILEAYEDWAQEHGPIHVIQVDAHLDFVDVRHGVSGTTI